MVMSDDLLAGTSKSTYSSVILAYLETAPALRRRADEPAAQALFSLAADDVASSGISFLGKLAKSVLFDVSSNECAWSPASRLSAIRLVKELSRFPSASKSLADSDSIQSLIELAQHIKTTTVKPLSPTLASRLMVGTRSSSEVSSNAERLDLVLRALNNVLFLHDSARPSFAAQPDGVRLALDLIDKAESAGLVFLSARLVFFATLSPSDTVKRSVEELGLVDVFSDRLTYFLQSQATAETTMAITELLKAFFNVSLHYPKIGKPPECASSGTADDVCDALLPFLAPCLTVLTSLTTQAGKERKLVSPWTNAIAVLLNYSVKAYEVVWTGETSLSSSPSSRHSRVKHSKVPSSSSISSASSSEHSLSAIHRSRKKASMLIKQSLSTIQAKSSETVRVDDESRSVVNCLIDLIETFCLRYLASHDIDDGSSQRIGLDDGIDIEATGEPAILLLRKMAEESDSLRMEAKARILPDSIDRTIGLDRRSDLTGIMVRLMNSHDYPRLARASGEALLSICGGQATRLTATIGYGPCAGFLMSIGQAHSMPGQGRSDDSDGRAPIDPITGKLLPTEEEIKRQDAASGLSAMSEEEKEAEAERLFTLFDRMNRTGIISANPMQTAVESGRIRALEEEEEQSARQEAQRQDEMDETIVDREMRAFRSRK